MIRSSLRALRSLRNHALISISAVLTLAIAIGANTAIFSVVSGLLFDRLPFPDPDRIVVLWQDAPHDDRLPVSLLDYFDWKERATSFESMGAYRAAWLPLGFTDGARHVEAVQATPGVFGVLGLQPLAGRLFNEEEDVSGAPVAVVGAHVWRELGREGLGPDETIRLGGVTYRVIGIMDMSFSLPWIGDPDLWIPMGRPESLMNHSSHSNTLVVGRLADGRETGEALAEIAAISTELSKEHPATNAETRSGGDLLANEMRRDYRAPILLLWASVSLVLLIACANVMNLLLVRGETRRRELAVRRALGATRSRIALQILGESMILAIAGAAGGLLIARWAVPLLARINDSRTMAERIELDGAVVAFTLIAALVTGLLSGAIPALRQSRESVSGREALLSSRSGSAGISRSMLVAQIALALVLTTASILMISSFRSLMRIDAGFDTEGIVHAGLSLPAGNRDEAAAEQTWRRILERAEALPGVESASLSHPFPLTNNTSSTSVEIEGVEEPVPGRSSISLLFSAVSPAHFETLGIDLLRGRTFRDSDDAANVIIVDREFVDRFYPGADPLERHIRIGGSERRIIGVVEPIRLRKLHVAPEPYMYVLWRPAGASGYDLALRTRGDAAALLPAVREMIRSVDADIPLDNIQPMAEVVSGSANEFRIIASLLTVFSATALFLAALGTWGVTAWSVARRTREIGVRMAMGAGRGEIFRQLMTEGFRTTLIGLAIGAVLAVPMVGAMRSILVGVDPADPWVILTIVAVLFACTLSAVALPARKATKVEPNVALREE